MVPVDRSIDRSKKPRGIKEIADALGISIGTVDRALHDRTGISPKTRAKVLKMAEKLNYSPNVAARNLKLHRQLRIGVYLPRQIASYYDSLRDGIRFAAASELSASIQIHYFDYPTLGEGDAQVMADSNWSQFDGLILAPGHPAQISDIFTEAQQLKKAIVCVTTDAPRMSRLACVTTDSFVSGGMAAELLGSWISEPGEVALFTGDLQVQDHADKLRGFAASLATYANHLRLLPAIETHDSCEMAYKMAKRALIRQPKLKGIYVNTANCLPVLTALRESGRIKSIRTITTDLFSEMVSAIESGEVSASLYQRPFTQGKLALEALAGFLARGREPKLQTRLAPHIIVRSNLGLFMESWDRQLRR
jgi:LacI family transcriptional regulator